MFPKMIYLPLLALVYLGLVAFTPTEGSELVWNGPVGWTAFVLVMAVILVAAVLLIIQSRQTPENVAAYHLDHAAEGHADHDSHAANAEEPVAVMEHKRVEEVPAAAAVTGQPSIVDDLTKIEGIGPKITELLNQAGIATFAQLAEADDEQLSLILKEAGSRFGLADPSSWKDQARLARDGDWVGLKALTEQLRGGRAGE